MSSNKRKYDSDYNIDIPNYYSYDEIYELIVDSLEDVPYKNKGIKFTINHSLCEFDIYVISTYNFNLIEFNLLEGNDFVMFGYYDRIKNKIERVKLSFDFSFYKTSKYDIQIVHTKIISLIRSTDYDFINNVYKIKLLDCKFIILIDEDNDDGLCNIYFGFQKGDYNKFLEYYKKGYIEYLRLCNWKKYVYHRKTKFNNII
jgi:hypothetical protein